MSMKNFNYTIEFATFRLVAQCLNQLYHRVPREPCSFVDNHRPYGETTHILPPSTVQFEGRQVHFYFEERDISVLPDFANSIHDVTIQEHLILFTKIRYMKIPRKRQLFNPELRYTQLFSCGPAAQRYIASPHS